MLHKITYLKDVNTNIITDAYLEEFVCSNDAVEPGRKRPAMLICPGGGYGHVSPREGEPVALQYAAAGFHAFVLHYSVAPATYPTQLTEASAALCYLREKAEEYAIDSDKIIVVGFSAGGHLACSLGLLYDEPQIKEILGLRGGENKPNGMVLCYPVITSGDKAHKGSFINLCGGTEEEKKELFEQLSLEKRVTQNAPPAFLWHTVADAGVPVENSLLLATALQQNGVSYEMHLYPYGDHGLSLANELVFEQKPEEIDQRITTWIELSIGWVKLL